MAQSDMGKKSDPVSKIIKVKKAGSVAPVTEYLPSKVEALSSNSRTIKKKKKKKKRQISPCKGL
jgi:hypothetical protein